MLEYFERGDGPRVVLLLHGFLGSGRNLASLARSWSERDPGLRLVMPDLTGHGSSPPLSGSPSLEKLAGGVLELARHLTEDPVRMVGHSLGGRVAMCAAGLDAMKVAGVTLLDISPGPVVGQSGPARVAEALVAAPARAPSRMKMGEQMREVGVPRSLVDWLLMNLVRDGNEYRWRVDRSALARLHEATRALDLWPLVESRQIHVDRCIRGGQSDFVTDGDVARFRQIGVAVDTIADAGHFLHAEALGPLTNLLSPP